MVERRIDVFRNVRMDVVGIRRQFSLSKVDGPSFKLNLVLQSSLCFRPFVLANNIRI